MDIYVLNFDGSCGPKNPGGTAAWGTTLKKNGVLINSGSGVIGSGEGMTNNLAEFVALVKGLETFILNVDKPSILNVLGDSKLVVNIMNRVWKGKPDLPYTQAKLDALQLLKSIRINKHHVTFDWVPREKNQECDDLSKINRK